MKRQSENTLDMDVVKATTTGVIAQIAEGARLEKMRYTGAYFLPVLSDLPTIFVHASERRISGMA